MLVERDGSLGAHGAVALVGAEWQQKPPDTIVTRRLNDSRTDSDRGGCSPTASLMGQTYTGDHPDCADCRGHQTPGSAPDARNDDSYVLVGGDAHHLQLVRQHSSPAQPRSAYADQAPRRAGYCPGPFASAKALSNVVQDSLFSQKTDANPLPITIPMTNDYRFNRRRLLGSTGPYE
jgi:hypothetical protein